MEQSKTEQKICPNCGCFIGGPVGYEQDDDEYCCEPCATGVGLCDCDGEKAYTGENVSPTEYRVQCPLCFQEFDKPDEFAKMPRHTYKKDGKDLDCPGSFETGMPIVTPLGPPNH
ncbi:MAG: hypothetical protein QF530_11445 [SAR202 cluster bacterium]|mgnify:CR=1 FL=1|jgi:hypothetical protein|nr:hypothetical protein [SAR202 cluster bacterium]|tara:strand:- start:512 stop:856 length:345 start_codon:yes stop_codon:yes gene_type:complete